MNFVGLPQKFLMREFFPPGILRNYTHTYYCFTYTAPAAAAATATATALVPVSGTAVKLGK